MAETSGSITVSTKLGRMAACLLCVCCVRGVASLISEDQKDPARRSVTVASGSL
jgi:hypothetical protein